MSVTKEKNLQAPKQNEQLSLTVTEGVTVKIIPNQEHEFLMSSQEVANGYGVSYGNIREHKRVSNEFIEGKHFITGVRISDSDPANKTYWTKRGVVRLGFFIKSQQAKLFRDWAEDLIIDKINNYQPTLFEVAPKQLNGKRKHNRLTQERLIDILHDVCRIDDAVLRNSIANKLKGGAL
ncbi:MAG: hypothetical protein AB7G44_03460 [Bacteroidia bacterium]